MSIRDFFSRSRDIPFRGVEREASNAARVQRLQRASRLMDLTPLLPTESAADESKRYAASERELRSIEMSLHRTADHRNVRVRALHDATVDAIAHIREGFTTSYTVRVEIANQSDNLVRSRFTTVHINTRARQGTEAFLDALEAALTVRVDLGNVIVVGEVPTTAGTAAEQKERAARPPVVQARREHSNYNGEDDSIVNYYIRSMNNVSVNLHTMVDAAMFGSELSYMNISGHAKRDVFSDADKYKNACGFELIFKQFGTTIADTEAFLNIKVTDGLTPDQMLRVFQHNKQALIVADMRGNVIVHNHYGAFVGASKKRKPVVYVACGAHWRIPTVEFRRRIMNKIRGGNAPTFVDEQVKNKKRAPATMVGALTFAEAIETSNKFINATPALVIDQDELKAPESEAVYDTEYARLLKIYKDWYKVAKKPFSGKASYKRTADEKLAFKTERKARKATVTKYKLDYAKRLKEYNKAVKVLTRKAKKPTTHLSIFLAGRDCLKAEWIKEIKAKRLYTSVKYRNNAMVSITLNSRVKITIDVQAKDREKAWNELAPKDSFYGTGWSGIASKHFGAVAKRHGGFIRSTPNATVLDFTGNHSCGGVTYTDRVGEVDMNNRTAHIFDCYRQYASIMREGGFYTIDIDQEIVPSAHPKNFICNKKIRTDRIYFVQAPLGSKAYVWLGGGFVDYQLISAWYDSYHTPEDVAYLNDCIVGYLPIVHQRRNDDIIREFVDTCYATLSSDAAKKRVVNFMCGLFVSDYGRKAHQQYFTDDKDECAFYFTTMNAHVKYVDTACEYKTSKGGYKKVYAIRGYSESTKTSTNIYVNRAIVQRGRAQMLRMLAVVEANPHAQLIGMHVDSMAYTLPVGLKPLFDIAYKPSFGDLRTYKKGLKNICKMPTTPIMTPTDTADMYVFRGIPENAHKAYITQYRESIAQRTKLRAIMKGSMTWYNEEYKGAPVPADLLLGCSLAPKAAEEIPWNGAIATIEYESLSEELNNIPRYKTRAFVEAVAGCGKTYYLNQCSVALLAKGFRVCRATFTHAAAQLIDGGTLHSLFGMSCVNGTMTTSQISRVIDQYDVLLIDEAPYVPIEVWRILQRFPPAFRIYCFGDCLQNEPVMAPFTIANTQAMRSVCGGRRMVLTKQWRSNPEYVADTIKYRTLCQDFPTEESIHALPAGVNDGSKLTMAEMADMRHLFCTNAPRARLNSRIASYKAASHDGATRFNMSERCQGIKYSNYEYPNIDVLASIVRAEGPSFDPSLLKFFREYLAKAERTSTGGWRVGVNYVSSGARERAEGMQKFPRWIRAATARDYTDLDFENCGYHMMSNILKTYRLPYDALTYYIDNRAKCLKDVHVLNPKHAYIILLNGGNNATNKQMRAIAKQVKALHKVVEGTSEYIDYVRAKVKRVQQTYDMDAKQTEQYLARMKVDAKPETYTKKLNELNEAYAIHTGYYTSSYISHLTYRREAVACRALVQMVTEQLGRTVPVVKCFDGAMFYKIDPAKIDLVKLSNDIYSVTGLLIPVKVKPVYDHKYELAAVPPFTGLTADELVDVRLPAMDEYPAVYPGMPCVMYKTIKLTDDIKLFNNEAITFTKLEIVDNVRCFVFERADGTSVSLDEFTARRSSRPSYCLTGHKAQGLTMPGKICIHQFYEKRHNDTFRASPAWRYVALTRAVEPKNIYIR